MGEELLHRPLASDDLIINTRIHRIHSVHLATPPKLLPLDVTVCCHLWKDQGTRGIMSFTWKPLVMTVGGDYFGVELIFLFLIPEFPTFRVSVRCATSAHTSDNTV